MRGQIIKWRMVNGVAIFAILLAVFLGIFAIATEHSAEQCDCTVEWEGEQIPIEDAIGQIGEGLFELNCSINQSECAK